MPSLPTSSDFTNSAVTEANFKTAISDLREYLAFLLGVDGTKETAQLTLGAGFPAGTRMSFNQTLAPVGWTKDTSSAINDSLLRIVTGTVSSGGSVAFSTFNAGSSTGATTLSTAQMPSHTHRAYLERINVGAGSGLLPGGGATTSINTGATGGGGSHTHTLTSDIKYRDFIIATKN